MTNRNVKGENAYWLTAIVLWIQQAVVCGLSAYLYSKEVIGKSTFEGILIGLTGCVVMMMILSTSIAEARAGKTFRQSFKDIPKSTLAFYVVTAFVAWWIA